jgi:eukaryotic-like serine/threonine-protein kinase
MRHGTGIVMDDLGVEIGATVVGKYRIDRIVGKGGMGIVAQAMHLQLGQPVAMKFLLPEVRGDQQIVQRFVREAQAAAQLRSEHVARVIDVGALENSAPYMVLEYLDGTDLAHFPRSQLTVGATVDLVLQACEALAEAHALGIVHRDIKPGNFFVTRGADGGLLLKVLDFGISKVPAANSELTGSHTVIGTPVYMSPEQMRSPRAVDHRSDIWSLGVVLYELLQGAPPYRDDAFLAMAIKVVNDPLPALSVRLPGDLDQIVYRCLEKNPAKRFQTVAALAHALSKYAQSETQAAISVQRTKHLVGPTTPHVPVEPDSTRSEARPSTLSGSVTARTVPLHKRIPRRRPIAVLVVAAGIVALAVAGSYIAGSTRSSTARERPAITTSPPSIPSPTPPATAPPTPANGPTTAEATAPVPAPQAADATSSKISTPGHASVTDPDTAPAPAPTETARATGPTARPRSGETPPKSATSPPADAIVKKPARTRKRPATAPPAQPAPEPPARNFLDVRK